MSLLLGLPASGKAEPVSYGFTFIGEAAGPALDPVPALNNGGTVAFVGQKAGVFGVFVGNGGPVAFLPVLDGAVFISGVSLNNAGGVAVRVVRGGAGGSSSVARSVDGGSLVRLYTAFGGGMGVPSLNSTGTVAFAASTPPFSPSGVFVGSGGPTTTIADGSGPFSGGNFGIAPSLNNLGTVAFSVVFGAPGSGIFTGSGGPVTLVADTGGPFNGFGDPSLNDAGMVAFLATLDTGDSGIFKSTTGGTTPVVDTDGAFSGFSPSLSLNNLGAVAFLADLDAGGSGIFAGPDPVLDRVISTGDALFNSTVVGLSLSREGLNDAGQVAFLAQLADGRTVIVRADPGGVAVVPEPAALLLLGAGVIGLGLPWMAAQRRTRVLHATLRSLYGLMGQTPSRTIA